MEHIFAISDRFFSMVEWGFQTGGWWFLVGSFSCTVFVVLGFFRSPYR